MRKREKLKKGLALILSTVLLGGQLSVTPSAEGISTIRETQEFTDRATRNTGIADWFTSDGSFTDGSDAQPGETTAAQDPAVDSIFNAANVESEIAITQNPTMPNGKKAIVEWQISGNVNTTISLGITMPEKLYNVLSKESQANEDGECLIPISGEDRALVMKKQEVERDGKKLVLLTFDCSQPETYKIEMDFGEEATEDGMELLTSEWKKGEGEWNKLAEQQVAWFAPEPVSQPETMSLPEMEEPSIGGWEETTPTPEVTPEVTEEVTPTPEATPEVTEEVTPTPEATPEVTEEVTPTPEATPEVTEEVTPTPEATPEVTEEVTPTPEVTPEVTEEVTPTPEATPEVTEEATPTPEAAPTEAPDMDPGSVEDISLYSVNEQTVSTGTPMDLTSHITGVSIVDPVNSSNYFRMQMNYGITNTELKEAQTNTVTYHIPDSLILNDDLSGIVNNDPRVGSYTIVKDPDGKGATIQVIFTDEFLNGPNTTINGTLSFWATVDADQTDDQGNIRVPFSETHSLDVKINKTIDKDVTVAKKTGETSYNAETNTMYFDYEVEVSTTKGTYGPVSIKDKIPWQKAKHMQKDFKVYKVSADGTRTEVNPNPLTIGEEPDQNQQMDSVITGQLASLNAGEKYIIQYTAEKKLEEGQQEGDLNNMVEVKGAGENNGDLNGKDEKWQNKVLKDISVEKTSTDPPVINRAEGKITNTYGVTISSNSGSAGDIAVEDVVTTTGVTGQNISYQNVVVTKTRSDGTTETITHSLAVDANGKLTGTLPQLGANESYLINYDMELSNLPANAQVTVGINNSFKVTHGSTSKEDEDKDSIPWVGSQFGNYLKKSGAYKNGVITWTIVVNEKGYQNVDGMTLTDTLNEQLLEGQQVQITTNGKTFNAAIPYTFTNGSTVTTTDNQSYTIDTSQEFTVTYTTPVNEAELPDFVNHYKNVADLSGSTTEYTVDIVPNIIDKFYENATSGTVNGQNGIIMNWSTEIDVPANGLKKDGYYTDLLRNGSYAIANDTWYTRDMLEGIVVKVGDTTLTPGTDYRVEAQNSSWGYQSLESAGSTDKLIGFKIILLRDIPRSEGEKLKVSYSSFALEGVRCINEGSYYQDGTHVDDAAIQDAKETELLSKRTGDGEVPTGKSILAIYDENKGKYILTYRLAVNASHDASGDIIITDTLPAGLKFIDDVSGIAFKNSNSANVTIKKDANNYYGGAGIRFELINGGYTPFDERDTREVWNVGAAVSSATAKALGITFEFSADRKQMKVRIPNDAYRVTGTKDGVETTYSISTAIYYAAEIESDLLQELLDGGSIRLTNSAAATTTTGALEASTVTNEITSEKMEKTGTYNSQTSTLDYSLDINPKAESLHGDGKVQVTIEDICAYPQNLITALELKPDSVKLYDVDASGNTTLSSDPYSVEVVKTDTTMNLQIIVPDGKHYRLDYSYMVNVNTAASFNQTITVTNSAKIQGLAGDAYESEDSTEFQDNGSSATAEKSYAEVTLYKQDAANAATLLAGAAFVLERYTGTTWAEVGTFVTGADGSVKLGEKLDDTHYRIGYNCAYRLREVTAPSGYQLLNSEKYFIVYSKNAANELKVVPSDWTTNTIYTQNMLNVTNGYLVVTNAKQDTDKTSFSVKKRWVNPDWTETTPGYDSVVVKLFRSTQSIPLKNTTTLVGTITLNAGNEWSHVWNNLEKYQADGVTPWYYCVGEVQDSNGNKLSDTSINWIPTYNTDGAIPADGDLHQFEITNRRITEDSTTITVNKQWLTTDGNVSETALGESVDVQLNRRYYIPGATSADQTHTVTVNVIDKNNKTGYAPRTLTVPYGAKVRITMQSPGFSAFVDCMTLNPRETVTYENAGRYHDEINDAWSSIEVAEFEVHSDTTVTIGNQYASYDYSTLSIQQISEGQSQNNIGTTEGRWVEDTTWNSKHTISATKNWSYTWQALPTHHPAGYKYYYYLMEDPIDGFSTEYVYNGSNDSGLLNVITDGTVIVKNRKTSDTYTSLKLKKQWFKKDETAEHQLGAQIALNDPINEYLPEIQFNLYRSKIAPTQTEQMDPTTKLPTDAEKINETPIAVNKIGGWEYTWNRLSKFEGDVLTGSPYYYYVQEIQPSGITLVSSFAEGNGSQGADIIVKNVINTQSITVDKKWYTANNVLMTGGYPSSIYVQLYKRIAVEGTNSDIPYGSPVILGNENNWQYTWENLPENSTYYAVEGSVNSEGIFEPGAPTGYTVKYQAETVQDITDPAQSPIANGTIHIKNIQEPTNISVEKVWAPADGTHPDNVTMKLYRSTTPPTSIGSEPTVEADGTYNMSVKIKVGAWQDASGNTVNPLTNGSLWVALDGLKADGSWDWNNHIVNGSLNADNTWSTTIEVPAYDVVNGERTNIREYHLNYANVEENEVILATSQDGSLKGTKITVNNLQSEYVITVVVGAPEQTGTPEPTVTPDSENNLSVAINVSWTNTALTSGEIWYQLCPVNLSTGAWETPVVSGKLLGPNWTATANVPAYKTENGIETEIQYALNIPQTITQYGAAGGTDVGTISYSGGYIKVSNTSQTYLITATSGVVPTPTPTPVITDATYANVTVSIGEWKNHDGSAGTAPTQGYKWVGFHQIGLNGEPDWNVSSYSGDLESSNNWTQTYKLLISAKVDGVPTTYKYRMNYWNNVMINKTTSIATMSKNHGEFGPDITEAKEYSYSLIANYQEGYSGNVSASNDNTPSLASTVNLGQVSQIAAVAATGTASTGPTTATVTGLIKPDDAVYMENMDRILTASSETPWSASWHNLDKTDANGNTYYYYVEEARPEGYGYSTSYEYTYKNGQQSNGIEKVTVTNTQVVTPNKLTITVNKAWTGYGSTETDAYQVTVMLQKEKDNVKTDVSSKVLNKASGWTASWTDLEEGYKYSVKEVQVTDGSNNNNTINNYNPGYSEASLNKTGTITITNTKKSQGITLPGTGSKYPLVFYGSGLAFLFISMIWMLHTFKKRKISMYSGKGGKNSNN